jgi:hypothetical protein
MYAFLMVQTNNSLPVVGRRIIGWSDKSGDSMHVKSHEGKDLLAQVAMEQTYKGKP